MSQQQQQQQQYYSSRNDIKVTIPTLEMQNDGPKSKLYIAYFVEVNKDNDVWRVPRRFQDFRTLHKILKSQYPSVAKDLPALPSRGLKGAFSNKFDPKFTLERRQLLEVYICQVLDQLNVENCAEIDDFLEYSEHMIYFSINKLGALDGVQDIIENLKHVSETHTQVAAFHNVNNNNTMSSNMNNDDEYDDGMTNINNDHDNDNNNNNNVNNDNNNTTTGRLRKGSLMRRNNSSEIESVLEDTAKKIRLTMEHMDSMREDMQAGIHTKTTVLEMLKSQLEAEQDKSRIMRVSQTKDRNVSETKLQEVQVRIKRLQTEKKLLVGEIKSLKKKSIQLLQDKERYKNDYVNKSKEMNTLEHNIKKDRKNNSSNFNKTESERMILNIKSWIDRLKSMKNIKDLQSTYSNVDEVNQLQLYTNNINQWIANGLNLKTNNAHELLGQKLEDLLGDNLNIRTSLYNERLKMV